MQEQVNITEQDIRNILEEVKDPEVPVLSVIDLGIIRKISQAEEAGKPVWEIQVSPTYSGCPAMDMIHAQIRMTLFSHGIYHFVIRQVLSPAWTTEWMTEQGKEKLRAYGIAPPTPLPRIFSGKAGRETTAIACPRCHSTHTHLISAFGSTACKALYQCDDCREPFDYFKCH
jgi:ring-1,2-phenylacetyl-CoA epoxidase subunit PaaD